MHMKKIVSCVMLLFVILTLFSGCGSKEEAEITENDTAETAETAAPTEETEESPKEDFVSLNFDPNVYQSPDDDDYLNVLAYASNSSDQIAQVKIRYRAFDSEGNVFSVFEQFGGKYREQFTEELFIPAGAKDLPVAFVLPMGFRYDLHEDKQMPEIDHMEYEILEINETELEDLADHFSPGEPELKNGHLYVYVGFDQDVADSYESIYPNYTILGYKDGEVAAVCCKNWFPYSNGSYSVAYAKENDDSSIMAYHSLPAEAVDEWKFFLGCVGGN